MKCWIPPNVTGSAHTTFNNETCFVKVEHNIGLYKLSLSDKNSPDSIEMAKFNGRIAVTE